MHKAWNIRWVKLYFTNMYEVMWEKDRSGFVKIWVKPSFSLVISSVMAFAHLPTRTKSPTSTLKSKNYLLPKSSIPQVPSGSCHKPQPPRPTSTIFLWHPSKPCQYKIQILWITVEIDINFCPYHRFALQY